MALLTEGKCPNSKSQTLVFAANIATRKISSKRYFARCYANRYNPLVAFSHSIKSKE